MHRTLAPLFLAPLVACAVVHEEDTVFVEEAFDEIHVQVDHGTVEIVAAEEGEALRVERDLTSSAWNQASSNVEVRDGALRIFASCGGPVNGCSADHRVFVPAATSALVDLGSGDVVVVDLDGDVVAWTGAGDIDVVRVSGTVDVETFAGDVTLHQLTGPVRATTDAGEVVGTALESAEVIAWSAAGDVELELLGAIERLDARTSAGDVDLRVPAGAYALDLTAEVGEVVVEGVTDHPEGALIHAHSAAGNVRLAGSP